MRGYGQKFGGYIVRPWLSRSFQKPVAPKLCKNLGDTLYAHAKFGKDRLTHIAVFAFFETLSRDLDVLGTQIVHSCGYCRFALYISYISLSYHGYS